MKHDYERPFAAQFCSYGPIEYTRLNRSGGHIAYLIGVPSGRAILLSSSQHMPDNERLVTLGLPKTPLNLAFAACFDREVMFLQRAAPRGPGFTEPEIIGKIKAAGYELNLTLLVPLDGRDDGDKTFLRAYTGHGNEIDTAAALVEAMRPDNSCNAGLYDTVHGWLRHAEQSHDIVRAAKIGLRGRGGDQ